MFSSERFRESRWDIGAKMTDDDNDKLNKDLLCARSQTYFIIRALLLIKFVFTVNFAQKIFT